MCLFINEWIFFILRPTSTRRPLLHSKPLLNETKKMKRRTNACEYTQNLHSWSLQFFWFVCLIFFCVLLRRFVLNMCLYCIFFPSCFFCSCIPGEYNIYISAEYIYSDKPTRCTITMALVLYFNLTFDDGERERRGKRI